MLWILGMRVLAVIVMASIVYRWAYDRGYHEGVLAAMDMTRAQRQSK